MIMETISRYLLTFLLNSIWQIALVAGVAMLAARLMRNGPASHRHMVWVAALIAAVLLPLASLRSAGRIAGSAFSAPGAPQLTRPMSVSGTLPAETNSPPAPSRTISYAQTTASIFAGAYLLFLAVRLVRLVRAWIRTVEIRGRSAPTDPPLLVRQAWTRCLEAFRMSRVELRSSPDVTSPVVAGAWRKSVILPEVLFSSEDQDVLTTAIGHEMAHLARHDFALKLLYEILYLPIAFHPASWLILRGLEETREVSCDELVTQKLLDPAVYARSIMNIAAVMTALPEPGYTLGVFDRDILEQRIRRLVHRPHVNMKRARLVLAGALSAVALCAVIASGVPVTARAQSGDLEAKVKAVEPLLLELTARPADEQLMRQARAALLEILAIDKANQQALNGMMTLSIVAKQPLEARQWALQMVDKYPREKSSYYCVGVTDWSTVYPAVAAARTAAGMRPEAAGFIPDPNVRRSLRDQYGPMIEEGLRVLDIALQIDPQYSDAMAYMNLMYRLKSNLAETAAEYEDANAKADQWVLKALAARKANPAPPSQGGNTWTVAPPPPPPPPPLQISDTDQASDAPMSPLANGSEATGSFWQVTGSGDTPAKTLMTQLKSQGFPVRFVLHGRDSLIRVMVGPFADDAARAEARSKLEAAGYRVVRAW
jgi:beta-lactamase regulating signal transducer with metallopeptidase domain/cell division septation protein DedD